MLLECSKEHNWYIKFGPHTKEKLFTIRNNSPEAELHWVKGIPKQKKGKIDCKNNPFWRVGELSGEAWFSPLSKKRVKWSLTMTGTWTLPPHQGCPWCWIVSKICRLAVGHYQLGNATSIIYPVCHLWKWCIARKLCHNLAPEFWMVFVGELFRMELEMEVQLTFCILCIFNSMLCLFLVYRVKPLSFSVLESLSN